MKLDQLKAFVWVARLRGFAAAAAKLNTTQPTITSRIQSLEDELGTSLFERTTRFVKITPEGRKCLAAAESIFELMDDIQNRVSPANRIRGSLIIGASEAITMSWLPKLMATINSEYPAVEVDVDIGSTRHLFGKLKGGEVDLLLVGGVPDDIPLDGFIIESLGQLRFHWMAANDYPPFLENRSPLTPADLRDCRIITYTKRSFMFYRMEEWFRDGGARMERFIMCDSIPLITSLVLSGQGIGLLPLLESGRTGLNERMRTLQTVPDSLLLEYYCVYPSASVSALPKIIAKLAQSVSSFSKGEAPMHDL